MSEMSGGGAPAPTPSAPSSAPSSTPAPSSAHKPVGQRTLPPPDAPFAEKSTAGTQPEGAPEAPGGETPAEKKARLLKLKVHGQETEVNVDEMDDNELATRLQLAEAARVRMQEAAELKKRFTSIVQAIREDPFKALQDPAWGVNLEELAKQRFIQQYEESQLPETEREKLQLQKQIEEYKRKEMQAAELEKQRQQEAVHQQVAQKMERDFMTALEEGQLPQSKQMLYMLAEVAKVNLQHGLELTPQQMVHEVNKRMQNMTKHVVSSMKGEQLARFLGEEVVKELIRYSVQKVRPEAVKAKEPPPAEEVKPKSKAKDTDALYDNDEPTKHRRRLMSLQEFRKYTRGG